MIIEKIGTGATTEEAYENAKLLLAAPEEAEIKFEILQEAKKRLFGLKTEPAKVKVWYEKEDPKPAPVKREQPKAAAPAPKKEAQPAKKNNNNVPNQQKKEAPAKKEAQKKPEPAPASEDVLTDIPVNDNDAAVKFFKLITDGMKISTCNVSLQKNETTHEYVYTLDCGADNGVLIGRRGETLDAIQYLLRLTENKGIAEEKHRKITVNVGDYREKRNQNLKAEAQREAQRVLKYGKPHTLEPMSAYERRIIHTAVQGIEGVTSHSVGSDANRRVVISLEDGVTPTNHGRGGYDRGGRGGDRRGGGRGGYQKREPYKPAVTREPRKDNAGALYGKIEIPVKNEE